jgi:hypothetical protein
MTSGDTCRLEPTAKKTAIFGDSIVTLKPLYTAIGTNKEMPSIPMSLEYILEWLVLLEWMEL